MGIPTINGTIAYFISPEGEIEYVPLCHIASVIKNPDLFKLSPGKITATYQKYKEPIGLEGKARHELLNEIIMSHWIRLRRYPNRQWSITLSDLCPIKSKFLQNWANAILNGGLGEKEGDIHLPVVISQLNSPRKVLMTVKDLCRFNGKF
jgi:hypothetical protein